VTNDQPVDEWLKPVSDSDASNFRTAGVGREREVDFVPFYRLHRRVYGGYWDLFTASQWAERSAEIAAERERQRKLEAATVAFAQPGNMQSERDFNYQGEEAWPMRDADRAGRFGRGWFSFDVPVESGHPLALVATYRGGERRREAKFEVLVEGKKVADQTLEKDGKPTKFYDVEYPIPDELVDGKDKVTVRFQSEQKNEIGPIFGVRIIRADAAR